MYGYSVKYIFFHFFSIEWSVLLLKKVIYKKYKNKYNIAKTIAIINVYG